MRVLVTGGHGFLGQLVCGLLQEQGHEALPFDLPLDVLDARALVRASAQADACIHLAAHKHAPYGEDQPAEVAETNIVGTRNVVTVFGPNVVLASTCKAADPMTCYGASKLIAERIALNAGGKVVRLVNVWGSSGSVAEIWQQIPAGHPLPVTESHRMTITPGQATDLMCGALDWPCGRYAPDCGEPVSMASIARTLFPGRDLSVIPLRRGDRPVERLLGEYERARPWSEGAIRIEHPADLPAAYAAHLRAS